MIDTSDGKFIVDGGMSRDLNRAYDWSLPIMKLILLLD